MATINITVEDHSIRVDNLIELAQGSNNFDTCAFTFDSSWDGFTLYASMYQNPKNVFKLPLDESNTCKIPVNVLQKSGWLYIGARGEKDDETIGTSIVVKLPVRNGAVNGNETGQEMLDQSQYEYLLGKVNELNEKCESLTKELISSLNGNIYVGSTQPTNGIEYWLDTSEDGDSGGEETDTPIIANTYTITRTLTRCTSSSTATIITEGSCYKEIITAEDGYTLSGATVNITMGDVDISDNYVNGELIIDEVSGDIVISIIAVTDNWEDITLTYNAYAYGTIYSDEGTTELATGTRGGAMSDIFEEDTYVSVTCTITGVAGYIGYCGEYSYRETHLYNATILSVGATTTVEMWIPAGYAVNVMGNYAQHYTIVEAKKRV